jgi:hypothetical protein
VQTAKETLGHVKVKYQKPQDYRAVGSYLLVVNLREQYAITTRGHLTSSVLDPEIMSKGPVSQQTP